MDGVHEIQSSQVCERPHLYNLQDLLWFMLDDLAYRATLIPCPQHGYQISKIQSEELYLEVLHQYTLQNQIRLRCMRAQNPVHI